MSLPNEFPPAFSMPGHDKPFFDHHGFSAYCFDTLRCSVFYGRRFHNVETEPSLPAASLNLRHIRASVIGIRNFPPPAHVRWVSKDGAELEASVDIAGIFADQRIRHRVPPAALDKGAYYMDPGIIMVITDRTISVYMEAGILFGKPERRGATYPHFASEALLVYSKSY